MDRQLENIIPPANNRSGGVKSTKIDQTKGF